MPQQQNKMAPVRSETTVPRHHNEPLVTSHKNRDSENHRSEFLAKVRKMAKNEIIFSQSEIFSKYFISFAYVYVCIQVLKNTSSCKTKYASTCDDVKDHNDDVITQIW